MKKVFILLITSLMIITSAVFSQEQPENIFTHKTGQFEIILLSGGQGQGGSEILIGATPQMSEECIPSGTFPNAVNAFLVKTPERNILVDAGVQSAILFSNLSAAGITPGQIDVILITHAHGDHTGGLLQDNKVAFPNAKIYISQPEYNYWTDDSVMQQLPEGNRGGFLNARKVFAAYEDKLNLFQPRSLEEELLALLPGISPVAAYGHTPGHTMFLVESGKEQLLIWGDLTHAMAIQMPYPSVAVTFDVNPGQAVTIREKVLDYVARKNIPVAGMHIPFPAIGTVSATSPGRYVFK